jgi:hypothetical protein
MVKISVSFFFIISFGLFSQTNLSIKNTGVNMTVAILNTDSTVQLGDTIIALYKVDDLEYNESDPYSNPDDYKIAGLTIWNGERLAIALWGNDNTSEMKDGFYNNEIIHWAIIQNTKYIPIQAVYRLGKNVWEPNGISIVDSIRLAGWIINN